MTWNRSPRGEARRKAQLVVAAEAVLSERWKDMDISRSWRHDRATRGRGDVALARALLAEMAEVKRLRAERDALLEDAEAMAACNGENDLGLLGRSLDLAVDAYRTDPRLAALRGEP